MRALLLLLLVPLLAAQDQAKVDFVRDVAPILEQHCIACHGPKKQKGDLRLDRRAHLFAAAAEDASVVAGDPEHSELIRRVELPLDDDDRMPNEGEPLAPAQIALLRAWVAAGAEWPVPGDEFFVAAEQRAAIPRLDFGIAAPSDAVQQRIEGALSALRERGVVAQRIADDTPAIEVNASLLGQAFGDADLAPLAELADVLVWLDLARTGVTDAGLGALVGLAQLRRLNLAGTAVGDAGIAALAALPRVEVCNVFSTKVGDAGLHALASWPRLLRVYAADAATTAAGVAAVQAQRPELVVDRGDYVEARFLAAAAVIERQQRPVNVTCPVTDKPIAKEHVLEHEGLRIAFCCGKCLEQWQQDPARFADRVAAYRAALVETPAVPMPAPEPAGVGAPATAVDADPAWDRQRLLRVDALLRAEVERGRHAGISYRLVHKDRLVAENAFGVRRLDDGAPMQLDTIVRIYSMSKLVTSIAALQLFEQGHFELNDPIGGLLPELRQPQVFAGGTADAPQLVAAERAITVRMLLNHTAGFPYDFGQGSPVQELYRRQDLWRSPSLAAFVAKVQTLPLLTQPGSKFVYGISTDVLGAFVERASAMPFADYVRAHVTGPLGLLDTDFDVPADKRARLAALSTSVDGKLQPAEAILGSEPEPGVGFASGGAGMFSTLADYTRLLQALQRGGELDGVRVLGRKTVELATHDSLVPDQGRVRWGDGWGLFSAVRTDPGASGELGSRGLWHWGGAATTHFFVEPHEQLVAVLFCQHLPYDQHKLVARFRTAVLQALR